MFARTMQSARHPILAQIIPIRRCNPACTNCNEFDGVSSPVPLGTLLHRIDLPASLGTTIVTLSGGEPTLHPELDATIGHIRRKGAIATVITDGLLLTEERIRRLNRAGLDYLQISIDYAVPDETSRKSLKELDRKLASLAALAEFGVTVNSVVGVSSPRNAGTPRPAGGPSPLPGSGGRATAKSPSPAAGTDATERSRDQAGADPRSLRSLWSLDGRRHSVEVWSRLRPVAVPFDRDFAMALVPAAFEVGKLWFGS
jgi:hypothetical protein